MKPSEQQTTIDRTAAHVRELLEGEGSGHDWWHIERVWRTSKRLATEEQADGFVVELAALLHDIADWKFHGGDDSVGPQRAKALLLEYEVAPAIAQHVADIIATMSFKGAGVRTQMATLEGKIVQDADRLDAIGAIGIARTFAYGGHTGRPMHDPTIKPTLHQSKEAYYGNASPTLNHFYEKLLLLKDRMNTNTARRLAEHRHAYIEQFLEEFLAEWDGER